MSWPAAVPAEGSGGIEASWFDEAGDLDAAAAELVCGLIRRRPDAVLALPTGRTPLGLYELLSGRARAGRVDFGAAGFFQLDEYVGLAASHPASFAHVLGERFLGPAGARAHRTWLLRGDAEDLAAECRRYDQQIAAAGGIDLAILGLGANGHVAFNEPGCDPGARTWVATLSPQTRAANAGPFSGVAAVPERGLTMGLRSLIEARAVLLLVRGEAKRSALAALLRGAADSAWPVTCLGRHPGLVVLADSALRPPAAGA